MYKILVYVDAENVTFSTFKPYWDEAIALNGFYEIIGKFYGSKDLLGGTVKQYLSLGLEYCETSALSSECHKNLADMKLITDCLHDVLHTYNTEVAQVYLLSKDYDFLPTVYKLKSLGMDTVTLGVDCRGDTKSVKTIIAYLHNVGFLPCADSKLFDNVFESICKAVDEVFAERTIDDFIAERMLIFISALVKEGYDVSVLQQLNVRDISFPVIVNVLGITDVKRLAHLFMTFTQRFYGAALPMRQNYDLIRRWLNGSV